MKYGDRRWTWREHLREASARAAALLALVDRDRPVHVGVLMGNTPEFLNQMAAAGLGGYVLCGLNTTRRGAALAADVRRADCQIVVTDAEHLPLLDGVDLGDVQVVDASSEDWARTLDAAGELTPYREVEALDPYMLIFTSGTSGDPKAVKVSHFMVLMSGANLVAEVRRHRRRHVLPVDAALPFQCVGGGLGRGDRDRRGDGSREVLGVEVPGRHPTVRRHVHELRRQAAGLHPGHPRTSPTTPTTRCASRSATRPATATSTSSPAGSTRWCGTGSARPRTRSSSPASPERPKGSLGKGFPGVAIYNPETLSECPVARFDEDGALINADEAVGELVNTSGTGFFTGYYNDEEATAERMRHGMYWSGDLAYRDADGWIYLAGRTADWMRVDGENLAAAPDRAHPGAAARHQPGRRVRGTRRERRRPDDGRGRAARRRDAHARRVSRHSSPSSPTCRRRRGRAMSASPPTCRRTATHKVLKRELAAEGPTAGNGELWVREPRGTRYTRAS